MRSPSPMSRSVSPEPAPTMQIFVRNVSGETFTLTVPENLSIANLITLLSVRTALPESDLRLVHAGKHLSSGTLEDYHVQRHATLHLAGRLRGGMPPKKIKCSYKECKEGAQRIIGDCGFCKGHYCGKHRLLEDHKCDGLEDVSLITSPPPSPPPSPHCCYCCCHVPSPAACSSSSSSSSSSSLLRSTASPCAACCPSSPTSAPSSPTSAPSSPPYSTFSSRSRAIQWWLVGLDSVLEEVLMADSGA